MLTPHVKAGDFASPFFYPGLLRCCERDVLQCSVTPAESKEKTARPI
jgi:hypothetical protein